MDTRVCDRNDDRGSSSDRLGHTPMERVLGSMLENAWQMANADLVRSATTISHMLSGNGAISDTLSKAPGEAKLHNIAIVVQRFVVSPSNSLTMKTPATEKKIPSCGLPLPASTSANTAAKDTNSANYRDHTSFAPKKAPWCHPDPY